jgi:hypothetical protein
VQGPGGLIFVEASFSVHTDEVRYVGDLASAVAEELVVSDSVICTTNKGDRLQVELIIRRCASIFVRPRPRASTYVC